MGKLDNGERFIILQEDGAPVRLEAGEPLGMLEAARGANPEFVLGGETAKNCQRAVPAYELRRRGFDVEALPRQGEGDPLNYNPFEMWDVSQEDMKTMYPAYYGGFGTKDAKELNSALMSFDKGARFEVWVAGKDEKAAHVFVAERVGNDVVFVDPQNEKANAKAYFDRAKRGYIGFFRMDTASLKPEYLSKLVKRRQ